MQLLELREPQELLAVHTNNTPDEILAPLEPPGHRTLGDTAGNIPQVSPSSCCHSSRILLSLRGSGVQIFGLDCRQDPSSQLYLGSRNIPGTGLCLQAVELLTLRESMWCHGERGAGQGTELTLLCLPWILLCRELGFFQANSQGCTSRALGGSRREGTVQKAAQKPQWAGRGRGEHKAQDHLHYKMHSPRSITSALLFSLSC